MIASAWRQTEGKGGGDVNGVGGGRFGGGSDEEVGGEVLRGLLPDQVLVGEIKEVWMPRGPAGQPQRCGAAAGGAVQLKRRDAAS